LSSTRARASMSTIDVWCRFDEAKDITTLIPNPRNPNTHGDKQIALLAKIIRNQGWRQPITISKRSGFIVKGHGRLAAAKMLQVEQVPVEFQDYATEADEYADLIADNRIAELAEVDNAMLSGLLADETIFDGFDMDLTGFDEEALGEMMTEPETDDTDLSDDLKTDFKIEIACKDEIEQENLFNEFSERGLSCRLLTL
jgi:ParB-like chromosome segregation protein Spo0J